jgi:hypothetical protein
MRLVTTVPVTGRGPAAFLTHRRSTLGCVEFQEAQLCAAAMGRRFAPNSPNRRVNLRPGQSRPTNGRPDFPKKDSSSPPGGSDVAPKAGPARAQSLDYCGELWLTHAKSNVLALH